MYVGLQNKWSSRASDRWLHAERLVAMILVGLLAVRLRLPMDVPLAFAVSLAALPMTWRSLARYRMASAIAALVVLAAASGILITQTRAPVVAVSNSLMVALTAQLLTLAIGLACLLWARSVVGARAVVLAFGLGSLASLAVTGVNLDNVWKFSLSVPVTLVVLGLPWVWGHRVRQIVCLVLIGGTSALMDSRSFTAMIAVTVMILVLERPKTSLPERPSRAWVALLRLAVIGVTAFLVVQAAILDGMLGESARERTEMQIERSGSALVGGRPEMGAAVALIADRPTGYGAGVLTTYDERRLGKSGMASLGYDPDNGYVDEYMFGRGFEVHSMLGDLWLTFGLLGALLAVFVLLTVVFSASRGIATGTISAVALLLAVRAVWDFGFSPIGSVMLYLPLTLALLLPAHEIDRPQDGRVL